MIEKVWGWVTAAFAIALVVMSFLDLEIPSPVWWLAGFVFIGGAVVFTAMRGMTMFVVKRLLEAVFVVFVIATMTFLLMRVLPGGPFDSEKALPPEVMENLNKKYKLNDPIFSQYLDYMGGLLVGDLGQSYKYTSRGITSIIAESLPNSIQLGVYALIISYLIGIPIGVIAGWKRGSRLDFSSMMVAISGQSLPSFLVAPIFILVFAKWLGWLEPALWEGPAYYVIPMVVLGIRPAAVIARLTRASVLEVIHSDYIRTAKAKGLNQRTILFKHVLRNSMIPVLSLSGPLAAAILTGAFVIEQIFAIPGIAKHLIQSVGNRDYPLILGTTLLFSVILVVSNLITDLLMAIVDPRVKMS
ncbi:MAG TPA: ABC transporter permease [Bdellovibrionales bacterium]|nr:ABC transporter permease [Bdellovibrionales bacterium]